MSPTTEELALLPKCEWSQRRWRIAGHLPKLIHKAPGGRGKPKREMPVVNVRLMLKDPPRSKIYNNKGVNEARRRLLRMQQKGIK